MNVRAKTKIEENTLKNKMIILRRAILKRNDNNRIRETMQMVLGNLQRFLLVRKLRRDIFLSHKYVKFVTNFTSTYF